MPLRKNCIIAFARSSLLAGKRSSDAVHAHKYGIYRDSEKRNMLIRMGYTPLCITSIQLDSPSDFALAADALPAFLPAFLFGWDSVVQGMC